MAEESTGTNRRPYFIGAGVLVVVLIGAYFGWRMLSPRESTDDAQITGHVSPVAPRVGGTVTAVRVEDNQHVKAGDVLVELDHRDYEIAVQKAEADLAAAQAAARAARTGVPITSTTATSRRRPSRS